MPCLAGCLAVLFPRGLLVLFWLLGTTASIFETRLWPLLGFFFMPYTTCAYALAHHWYGSAGQGIGLAMLIVGVVLDAGSHGGGARYAGKHRVVHVRRDG